MSKSQKPIVVTPDKEGLSGMSDSPWWGTSRKDAFRYEIHNATKKPVEPRESWQQAEYERVMGHEPPDLSLPQFDYNPRTKAGKALLEEMESECGQPYSS